MNITIYHWLSESELDKVLDSKESLVSKFVVGLLEDRILVVRLEYNLRRSIKVFAYEFVILYKESIDSRDKLSDLIIGLICRTFWIK